MQSIREWQHFTLLVFINNPTQNCINRIMCKNQLASHIKPIYYFLNSNSKYNSVFLFIFLMWRLYRPRKKKPVIHFNETDYYALLGNF